MNRSRKLVYACAALVASPALPSEADPRALEQCKATSPTFVQIAECLPDADVSFKTLDAFASIYPPAAAPLKDKCLELNKDDATGAATCVTAAIKSAIDLRQSLPSGSNIEDPVFNAVSDQSRSQKLDSVIKEARKVYPDKSLWGGNLYQPYR